MKLLRSFKYLFVLLFALMVLGPSNSVEARTVVRTGDTISIAQDQLIEGDFYSAGNIVSISGTISEDLLAIGTKVTFNGEVGADVLIIGADVDVHGTVGDDVRVIGGEVIIAEPVLGDVFVIGGSVKLLSSASVTGDLTVIGGQVEIAAPIEGKVLGWVESLRIDARVGGDVKITTELLTLGDKANVIGNIEYVSSESLVRSQNATVVGEEIRSDPVISTAESSIAALLLPLLALLFSVSLWFLLAPRLLQRVINRTLLLTTRSGLLGVGVLILLPIAIGILFLSMLGSAVALVLMALMVLGIVLSIVALPAVLAQLVLMMMNQGKPVTISLLTLIAGTLLVLLCAIIPFIGPIILTGFFVLTFGAMTDMLLRANR